MDVVQCPHDTVADASTDRPCFGYVIKFFAEQTQIVVFVCLLILDLCNHALS
jgi:hypothetical protein